VGEEAIKNNGYGSNEKKKESILAYWIFFVPLLNIMATILILVMINMKKTDLDKWIEEHQKKEEE